MSIVDVAMAATHLLFAGAWVGSVLFVTVGLLPAAKAGDLNAAPLGTAADRLRWISRVAAVVLFVTGGHMAARQYTVTSLTGSTPGYGVLAMVALWLVLAGLVEVAGGRIEAGTDVDKVRDPARAASPLLAAATLVGGVLLLLGGVLTAA
ncbi:MAG: transporter [Haloferacaceae archaeon]